MISVKDLIIALQQLNIPLVDGAALSLLRANVSGVASVDMGGADYTMSDAEATCGLIIVENGGDGSKTLTWPSSAAGFWPDTQIVLTHLCANKIEIAAQGGGITEFLVPSFHQVVVYDGFGAFDFDAYVGKNTRATTSGIKAIAAATYTLLEEDLGKILKFTSGSAQTLYVPDGIIVSNATVMAFASGAGGVTVAPAIASAQVVTGNTTLATGAKAEVCRDATTVNWLCV